MSRRYIVNAEIEGDKIKVTLGYWREGHWHTATLGKFENAQQAAHLATFVQEALHSEYERGLREAYDSAIVALAESPSDGKRA